MAQRTSHPARSRDVEAPRVAPLAGASATAASDPADPEDATPDAADAAGPHEAGGVIDEAADAEGAVDAVAVSVDPLADPSLAAAHDGPEHRNHRRVRAVKLVQYKRFDPDYIAEKLVAELGLGKTLDLSEGGLKFICTTPLPTSWGLHMDLAFADDDIVSVEGRIIHVEEVSEHRYRVGIKFVNLTDAARAKLKHLVADRASRSAPGVR